MFDWRDQQAMQESGLMAQDEWVRGLQQQRQAQAAQNMQGDWSQGFEQVNMMPQQVQQEMPQYPSHQSLIGQQIAAEQQKAQQYQAQMQPQMQPQMQQAMQPQQPMQAQQPQQMPMQQNMYQQQQQQPMQQQMNPMQQQQPMGVSQRYAQSAPPQQQPMGVSQRYAQSAPPQQQPMGVSQQYAQSAPPQQQPSPYAASSGTILSDKQHQKDYADWNDLVLANATKREKGAQRRENIARLIGGIGLPLAAAFGANGATMQQLVKMTSENLEGLRKQRNENIQNGNQTATAMVDAIGKTSPGALAQTKAEATWKIKQDEMVERGMRDRAKADLAGQRLNVTIQKMAIHQQEFKITTQNTQAWRSANLGLSQERLKMIDERAQQRLEIMAEIAKGAEQRGYDTNLIQNDHYMLTLARQLQENVMQENRLRQEENNEIQFKLSEPDKDGKPKYKNPQAQMFGMIDLADGGLTDQMYHPQAPDSNRFEALLQKGRQPSMDPSMQQPNWQQQFNQQSYQFPQQGPQQSQPQGQQQQVFGQSKGYAGLERSPGLIEQGTVDMSNRQMVQFPNGPDSSNATPAALKEYGAGKQSKFKGDYGSEYSLTITDGKRAVVIPSIYDGKLHSKEEAVANYFNNGRQHMGAFDAAAEEASGYKNSDAYTNALHNREISVNGQVYKGPGQQGQPQAPGQQMASSMPPEKKSAALATYRERVKRYPGDREKLRQTFQQATGIDPESGG